MKEDTWKTLIRQKLQDHEETPPPELWHDLQQALKQQAPAPRPTAPRHRWLHRLEATLGAAAALAALYWVVRYPAETPTATTPSAQQQPEALRPTPADQPQAPLGEPTAPTLTAAAGGGENSAARKKTSAARKNFSAARNFFSAARKISAAESPDFPVAQAVVPKDSAMPARQTDDAATPTASPRLMAEVPIPAGHATDRRTAATPTTAATRWTVGAYAGGLPTGTTHQEASGTFLMSTALPDRLPRQLRTRSTPLLQPTRDLQTKTDHKFPLRAGLSVRYRLNSRWALESGLFYSYLASDITSGSARQQYDISQKLQYVGLPLGVSYVLLDRPRWNLYAAGGAAAEMCVSGRTHSRYVVNGQALSGDEQDVRIRQLQWSVGATLGAQLNLTDHTGLYVEPGVSYYFDNHSHLSTYYQDHPLNFNLKVGLRFSVP